MNISLICACKNRTEALKVSLSSWIVKKEIKEIIIVDWSSDESLSFLSKWDERIKIVTVPNQKYFNQPQPLNLAASLATQEYLLKLDTDYILNPYFNFFDNYPIDENSVIQGPIYIDDKTIMDSPFFKYLRGLLFLKKENFEKVGGYNEEMNKFYAWEDDEIISRLKMINLNVKAINYDCSLIHIPHTDDKRFENFEGDKEYEKEIWNQLSQSYQGDELKWQFEYVISQHHIEKNKQLFENPNNYYIKSKINWDIIQFDNQNYFAKKL